jgi:hypothetical protein
MLTHNDGAGAPYVKAAFQRVGASVANMRLSTSDAGLVETTVTGLFYTSKAQSYIMSKKNTGGREYRTYVQGTQRATNVLGADETAPTTYRFSVMVNPAGTNTSHCGIHIAALWDRQLKNAEALQLDQEPYCLIEPEWDAINGWAPDYSPSPPPPPPSTFWGGYRTLRPAASAGLRLRG